MSISISMSNRNFLSCLYAGTVLAALSLGACRGNTSDEPPVH